MTFEKKCETFVKADAPHGNQSFFLCRKESLIVDLSRKHVLTSYDEVQESSQQFWVEHVASVHLTGAPTQELEF